MISQAAAATALVIAGAGAPHLSVGRARAAITTYERGYWHHANPRLSLPVCRRDSSRQVDCIVEIGLPNRTLILRDWVTLLRGGVVRVHPGSTYEEMRVIA